MSPASIAGDASGGPTPSAARRGPHGRRVARGLGGRDGEEALGRGRQLRDPAPEAFLDLSRHRQQRRHAETSGQFGRRPIPRPFDERERIPTGLRHDPFAHAHVDGHLQHPAEQRQRIAVVQTVDDQFGKRGEISDRPTGCEHQTHRVGQQPPRDEHEGLRRFAVEPLCAVHDAQQRTAFRDRREQAQDGQPDQQSVGRRPRGQTKSCPRRVPLRFRQRVEAIQHWRAQLVQRGKWNLHLRLDADCAYDPASRCRVDQMLEQRGLADARVAANHEHSCFADAHCVEKLFEREALLFVPDEIGATRRRARMNVWVDWQTLSPRRSRGYGCKPRLGSRPGVTRARWGRGHATLNRTAIRPHPTHRRP